MSRTDPLIRPASAADAGAIRRLVWRAQINPTGLDWRHFLVAVDAGGSVIACGQIKPHRGGIRELASIVVAPDWRGKGLARAVIERLMAQAGPPLYLTCRENLENLYNRFGFQVVYDPQLMPGYFRRVWRVFRVVRRFNPQVPRLLVMRWDG